MHIQLQHVVKFLTGRYAVLSYPVHATFHFRIMSLCLVTQEILEENNLNHEAFHHVTFPFIHLLVICKYSHLLFLNQSLLSLYRMFRSSLLHSFVLERSHSKCLPRDRRFWRQFVCVCVSVLNHSLPTSSGMLSEVGTWPPASTCFPLRYSQVIPSLDAICSEILTSINKQ